jgi:hypothetical protein
LYENSEKKKPRTGVLGQEFEFEVFLVEEKKTVIMKMRVSLLLFHESSAFMLLFCEDRVQLLLFRAPCLSALWNMLVSLVCMAICTA